MARNHELSQTAHAHSKPLPLFVIQMTTDDKIAFTFLLRAIVLVKDVGEGSEFITNISKWLALTQGSF